MVDSLIKENKWTKELEVPIYKQWKDSKIYQFNKNTKKEVYSIDTPPPYINSPIHIGQATTYVLMDMFARYHRMIGEEVLFPLGLDRNGLPIEIATEKKYNIKLTNTPREKFLEFSKKLLDEAGNATTDSFLRLGISFNSFEKGENFGEVYETDSEEYRKLTQGTFIDMWKKGLIYEDERITNWDSELQTTIADSEIEYRDIQTNFNDIKFKIKETGEEIIIGTTRPELICSCGAVVFNPEDKRYKHLEGKTVITPLYNKEVPIFSNSIAQIDKGTGLVMMCSAGDLSDIRFFRDMNLIPVISINQNGTMNNNAGFLDGLKVKEARKKIIEELKGKNLLIKQVQILHRTPISERSGVEIEFISMKEFYLKQLDYKEDMKKLSEQINFYSEESRQILLSWIDSVSIDWPISRRRYYATEIPLWYCRKCNYVVLPEKGKYYKPWKEKCPLDSCPKCKSKEFIGEERVFDTWFDSSISPLYILKYDSDTEFFKKVGKCSLRPQGKEIVRTWLYYTLLRSYLLTRKPIFQDVWINYHILDEKGFKMSKSKGNSIDPKLVLDKFGAESFRLWAAVEGNLDRTDFRCSLERIEGAGKTIAKLWNVARFVSMFPNAEKPKKLLELDKWIINEVNDLVKFANDCYSKYDFHNSTTKLKHFLWETFASHYLELIKPRVYNPENKFTKEEVSSGLYTLHYCLDLILKLLAPVNPLVTYSLYSQLRNKDIHKEAFPKSEKELKVIITTEDILLLNGTIWKLKKENNKSLKDEIGKLTLSDKFKPLEKDIVAVHHVRKIEYGKELKLEF